MTYAFTIAELRHHDVKALPDGAEYTGNQFAGNRKQIQAKVCVRGRLKPIVPRS
jgi:hypothetical protein